MVDGFDDPGIVSEAVVIEDLVDDQLGSRRDALNVPAAARVLASDDAADVCSVTVAVPGRGICFGGTTDRIHLHWRIGRLRTVPDLEDGVVSGKVRVIPANSRVEHRPGNPVADGTIAGSPRINFQR